MIYLKVNKKTKQIIKLNLNNCMYISNDVRPSKLNYIHTF